MSPDRAAVQILGDRMSIRRCGLGDLIDWVGFGFNDAAWMREHMKFGKLDQIIHDVRALGISAPLRAAYEASKRFGGHRLVFGALMSKLSGNLPVATPKVFALVDPAGVPAAAKDRVVAEAEALLDGRVVLFGVEVPFEVDGPTNLLIECPGEWPDIPWWEIDLRSDDRPGDVKWAWELGRHRHVVTLARAAAVSNDPRFAAALEATLWHWMAQNPPERGVHWYSNLEISIRALAWCEVLAVAGDRLSDGTRDEMLRHMAHAGRHLLADLPYTLTTMRNNHLLGDALGLIALARLFPSRDRTWGRIGRRLFDAQMARHMHADGSMIEDSLSYHRFVLEMLIRRVQLGGPGTAPVRVHMLAAAQFLVRLGVLDGEVPQHGDWDEGRILAASPGGESMAGSVRLALAVGGSGAPTSWRAEHDECAWYAETGVPEPSEPAVEDGGVVGGGISRCAVGDLKVWFKWGGGSSHQHADLSSVAMWSPDGWILGDPGTGTYNGPIKVRNYFRCSVAHNVLRVNGQDQLVPHRAFRWENSVTGLAGDPVRLDGRVLMWAVHDAYQRLEVPHLVVRAVVVSPDGIGVIDWVDGTPVDAALSVSLGPEMVWDPVRRVAATTSGGQWHLGGLDARSAVTTGDAIGGAWSATYGQWAPSTRLEAVVAGSGPLAWTLTENSAFAIVNTDSSIEVLGCDLSLEWLSDGAELTASHGGTSSGVRVLIR